MKKQIPLFILFLLIVSHTYAQSLIVPKVLAFYTAKNDLAHISYVDEANQYFTSLTQTKKLDYTSTNNWEKMVIDTLSKYDVILFLDTRPEKPEQREAFRQYMEKGGGWMGFHFAAFSLHSSAYDNNWSWYHDTFLGSGEYKSNTWRPTKAFLERITKNKFTRSLPLLHAPANEWYSWKNDLTKNKDIQILYAIDPKSFPLGTGPKQHEIWTQGFYPIIWTSTKYNMIYSNIGHNDMDYEHQYSKDQTKSLSSTFSSKEYTRFIIRAINHLAREKRKRFNKE
ncbi:hypothetical protein CEY12_17680 [Chryseobacterium sp. T16E-39]|uniref:ThuA domain-containing protein n=1 Tax=Chryseobacterium sp. T16E-39 TaxID=2015076 RepID=UPI000B5B30DB|nr:ThuA domain-containing protein [Chryseobacterium sp. T16E-39]ASK30901.1 hypothetical protein CEY12_12630 [Chryseobacterium sp. T16E-39]ASK31828.1 hypothetical protein CEY12_17680 [Chryseobacterium sp. T16E-39]